MTGFDGASIRIRERRISTKQTQRMAIRSRPGTFEWRYARAVSGANEVRYQAGSSFCALWERAGMDGPGSIDWTKEGRTQWLGLPDHRTVALDEVKNMVEDLGKLVTNRLTLYTVEGKTSRQIAKVFNQSDRDMAPVLASDLDAAGHYFKLW